MADAVALVREAIRDRSACLQCIGLGTGVPAATAFYQLDQLKTATSEDQCDFRGERRTVYRRA